MIFFQLFMTFFKIGLFGFSGGYGMLSLIQQDVVENHPWMSSVDFTDIVAISQVMPSRAWYDRAETLHWNDGMGRFCGNDAGCSRENLRGLDFYFGL